MKSIIVMCGVCMLLSGGISFAQDEGDAVFKWHDVREACHDNRDSEECMQQRERARAFCAEHPDKKRCRKMKAVKQCKQNPDSEECKKHKEKFKAYCEEHPGAKKCVRARIHKICKESPESDECLSAKEEVHTKYCEKHPNNERCS